MARLTGVAGTSAPVQANERYAAVEEWLNYNYGRDDNNRPSGWMDPSNAPPLFLLVGDSTTAAQAKGGGGWGTGFLALLARNAIGSNHGINGATSRGYLKSSFWGDVLELVRETVPQRPVFVTLQFGHNDQNPESGISVDEYRVNLVTMARDVITVGGIPVLVTPLARRDFRPDGSVVDNLCVQREATLDAYWELVKSNSENAGSGFSAAAGGQGRHPVRCINLNAASLAYTAAIGPVAARRYNLGGPDSFDTTHLNDAGSIVFGRMVADLLLGHPPALVPSGERDNWTPGKGLEPWVRPTPMMSGLIWHGKPA